MSGLTAEEHDAIQDLSTRVEEGDYYAILGVEPECSSAELKKAYYDLSRRYHPDRFYRRDVGEFRDQLEEVFTGINISFEVLSDSLRRRRFDLDRAKKDGGGSLSERRGFNSSQRPERSSSRPSKGDSSPIEAPVIEVSDVESSEPLPADAVPTEEIERVVAEKKLSPSLSEEDTDSGDSDTGSRRMSTYARHRNRLRRSRASGRAETGREKASDAESGSQGQRTPSRRPTSGKSKVADAVRGRITARLEKAKTCFEDGKKAIESENWVKAAASLYMAHQYNPKNEEYKSLWEETQAKSNRARAAQFMALAENAESFRNVREALENYKKATECDPEEGLAHYRFGQLLNEYSGDARGALQQFRQAVMKEPENVRYRMALADLYVAQGMSRNAIREYQKAVDLEPKNKEAKAALRKLRF